MTWIDPAAEPDFPPMLDGRRTVPGLGALEAAVDGARRGDLGAGDALWESDPTRVALAIVLQPEVSLPVAAQMLPLAMVALADCIGSLAPPQVGVMFRWPGTVTVNGARVGEVRVAGPSTPAGAEPAWLVVAVDIRMRLDADADEPGQTPDVTTLGDEGCEELNYLDVMGSFSKHFLTWLHIWEDEGFRPVHESWVGRVESGAEAGTVAGVAGRVLIKGMDEDGNLLVRREDGASEAVMLVDAIEISSDTAEA